MGTLNPNPTLTLDPTLTPTPTIHPTVQDDKIQPHRWKPSILTQPQPLLLSFTLPYKMRSNQIPWMDILNPNPILLYQTLVTIHTLTVVKALTLALVLAQDERTSDTTASITNSTQIPDLPRTSFYSTVLVTVKKERNFDRLRTKRQ